MLKCVNSFNFLLDEMYLSDLKYITLTLPVGCRAPAEQSDHRRTDGHFT